jgi:SpoVK/Ycf46/Vps4 family AAA+-type ATPase
VTDETVHYGADDTSDLVQDIVQVAGLALAGDAVRVQATVRRLVRRYRVTRPDLADDLVGLLRVSPFRSVQARGAADGEPIDSESRLPLVRREEPTRYPVTPILDQASRKVLDQLLHEHRDSTLLQSAGLAPTRTALFVGPPGVGKTLAAKWLADSLTVPLLVLDLSSVMSSYLGRTGSNLRRVLDYAKSGGYVLLLDELDAIAKRRDDSTEIGELKRLVTVLLQEIDAWPEGSLLLAATNHADLLDTAVWRRFEVVLDFPNPDAPSIETALRRFLDGESLEDWLIAALTRIYLGSSFNDIEREVLQVRRASVINRTTVEEEFLEKARTRVATFPSQERGKFAVKLMQDAGLSQRRAHQVTGVSRDTLRKYTQTE